MTLLLLLDEEESLVAVCPDPDAKAARPAPVAPLDHELEHKLQARERLIAQYITKSRIKKLLCILVDEVQEIEDALWQLATERWVDTAVGNQLDVIGAIVGQDRNGLSDDSYRVLIRARVKANRSDGTPPRIYEVAIAALGGTGAVHLDPKPPAGFLLTFGNVLPFDEGLVADLIVDAQLAGVNGVSVFTMSATNQMVFGAAADYPEFVAARGLDSAATPATGLGQLGRAVGPV